MKYLKVNNPDKSYGDGYSWYNIETAVRITESLDVDDSVLLQFFYPQTNLDASYDELIYCLTITKETYKAFVDFMGNPFRQVLEINLKAEAD